VFLSILVTVIATPGRTALLLSRTVPVRVAVDVCPGASSGNNAANTKVKSPVKMRINPFGRRNIRFPPVPISDFGLRI